MLILPKTTVDLIDELCDSWKSECYEDVESLLNDLQLITEELESVEEMVVISQKQNDS